MSEGNAQRYEIQLDNEPLFKMYHYAAGTSNDKDIWSDAAKTTPLAQSVVADANGQLTFFADGRYRLKFHDSDDVAISGMDYDNFLITADFATTFEDNQGTVLPSVSATNIGHLFTLLNGSNNILGVYQSDGTQYKAMVEFNASGDQVFTSVVPESHPWYDVTHTTWGADPTGAVDATTAIQSAINAAEVAGFGIIYLPAGTYKISSSLTVESNNIIIRGAGTGATTIKINHGTNDMLTLGDGSTAYLNIVVADMSLDASVARTGGAAVELNKTSRCILKNLRIGNQHIGINNTVGIANVQAYIDLVQIRNTEAANGIGISLTGGSTDIYINELFMDTSGSDPAIGIRLLDTQKVWITNCHLRKAGKGIYIFPGAGESCDRVHIENTDITICADNGIKIDAISSTSIVKKIFLDGCLLLSNSIHGMQITGHASSTIDGIYIDDSHIFDNAFHGIDLEVGINVDIEGCGIGGNSSGSSGTYHGINVDAGVSQWSVKNCRSGQQAGEADTQGYGLNIGAGAGDDFEVSDNNFKNNVTGGINDDSTGKDKLFSHNRTDDATELTAAATSMVIPPHKDVFKLTGTTTITNITSDVWDGRVVIFVFTDAVNIEDSAGGSGQIALQDGADWLTAAANDVITIVYIATASQWFEVSRSDKTP